MTDQKAQSRVSLDFLVWTVLLVMCGLSRKKRFKQEKVKNGMECSRLKGPVAH